MTRIFPYLIFCIITSSCAKQKYVPDSTPKYDILLNIGQSNNYYGIGIDSDLDAPDDRIKQLGRIGNEDHQIILAEEPLHHHSINDSAIGYVLTFAKLYADQYLKPDREVLIIPCGAAGSAFSKNDWNKGDHYYEDAIERVKFALTEFPGSELVAILWHQGESDEGNKNYQKNLDDFIGDLRADLNVWNTPFILGGMVPYWVNNSVNLQQIQSIIKSTPDRIRKTGYADPEVPFIIEKPDNSYEQLHYDAKGLRELGKRYFSEFENLIGFP